MRKGTRRINQKRTIKKGMSVVSLLKIILMFLLIIHLLFTDGWRIEKTTAENDNLNRKLLVEKR